MATPLKKTAKKKIVATTPAQPGRAPARKRRTQAERSEEMQQRLVEAAAQVLRRKGYAGLRTDEVSRVAKVSRGAQQHHFPSKDALVLATAAHLMRGSLRRGAARARAARGLGDPIEAIIQDAIDFFLGPDFGVMLDLVLAGSKDRALREAIYADTRDSRLAVEQGWVEVLIEEGVPRDTADKVVWITVSLVRGFAVRALWQRDEALFRSVLDEWKLILASHFKVMKFKKPKKGSR